MSKKVFNMQGGKHSAAAYSELEKWAFGSVVASITSFVASAGTGMNVNISTGAGLIYDTIARRIATDATETATVPTASASFNRIDSLVAYIDTAVSPTTAVTDNTNDILKFIVVAGTASASPTAPNDSAVQSAIGAGKPFMRLYDITVPQNATNTSAMTFSDKRVVMNQVPAARISGIAGLLGDIKYFTSNGTYTKPAGLRFVIVELVGGGGGGGGATGSAGAVGGGGGGGAYARKKIMASDLSSTTSVTVGAGGAGASAGGNNGAAGGDSSFGAHVSAGGGKGGQSSGNSWDPDTGGTATSGDLNINGKPGSPRRGNGSTVNGLGGDSMFGFGAQARMGAINEPGGPAVAGYGGGGGGGIKNNIDQTGGIGLPGIVIVTEFY